jgi:hypothetical protein
MLAIIDEAGRKFKEKEADGVSRRHTPRNRRRVRRRKRTKG